MMKSRSQYLILGLSTLLTATLFFWPAENDTSNFAHRGPAGGDSSGGSTGTRNSLGQLVHFDIYVHKHDFKDKYSSLEDYSLKNLTQQKIVYGEEQSVILVGYARDQYAVDVLLNKLKLWQNKSPILTALIKKSLKTMSFFVVDDFSKTSIPKYTRESMNSSFLRSKEEMQLKYSLDTMNQPLPNDLIPIAIYQYWQKAFSINGKIFDQLGTISRQAVFLKEALRNNQYKYIGGNLIYNMDDSTLQDLVYTILFSDPDTAETVDNVRLYRGNLEKIMKNDPRNILAKISENCARLKLIDLDFPSKEYCEKQDSSEELLSPATMLRFYKQLLIDQSYALRMLKKEQLLDFLNILNDARTLAYYLPLNGFTMFDID